MLPIGLTFCAERNEFLLNARRTAYPVEPFPRSRGRPGHRRYPLADGKSMRAATHAVRSRRHVPIASLSTNGVLFTASESVTTQAGLRRPKVSEPRSGCPSGEPSPLGNPMGLNRQNSELCRVPSSCFSGARTRNAEVNQRQEFECSAAYEAGGREFESLRARPHQWVYSGHIDLPKPPTGRDATLPAYAR